MGLDTVELVMAFEEAFGIEIPDDAAESIVTVRDAIDHIYARVEHAAAPACLTQRAFYRVRQALQNELGIERSRVRPATAWTSLIPLDHRRQDWARLGRALGYRNWPTLELPAYANLTIAAGVVGSAAIAYAVAPGSNALVAGIVGLLTGLVTIRASANWRTDFAQSNATVGRIAEWLATEPTFGTGWTREQVRLTIRRITADHLNVTPDFSDDASFIDDLGAD